jgi:hypothetical protein
LDTALQGNVKGLFNFAQQTLPQLLESVPDSPHPPTLIITGATASLKGSARFGPFAASKFAARALGQSLAREFQPQGVHVAHAIVDGIIDIPRTKAWNANDGKPDGKINPDAVSFVESSSRKKGLTTLTNWTKKDCRKLLVSTYPASIGLHPGAGSETVCREVLVCHVKTQFNALHPSRFMLGSFPLRCFGGTYPEHAKCSGGSKHRQR